MKRILEVCAGSVESVAAARNGGAARVELCSALEIGGITPSVGLITEARHIEGIALNVLIRPRGGDFLYNESEVATMEQDIIAARQCGADGVVIGALTAEGDVDVQVCNRLIKAAEGMSITFHRAFDMCRNPFLALEDIISLGCHRILTSGQAASAYAGITLIKQLVEAAQGRISIMPGCGVNATNATAILNSTGCYEIHASARTSVESRMQYRHNGVSMGSSDNDEYAHMESNEILIRQIVESIQ
ncbi:MAG: copper homeostasis protein CutC [Bacteroidaceae bacterium]|nr:copper homeostasis protein CutC [Bacteroidaceae bacterium]